MSIKKISIKQRIILIIFGLFLSVVLLEIGLRVGGFVFLSLQEYRNRISLKQKETYRIMCLGESTTAWGGKDSYPRQLEEVLNQRDIGIKFSVINKGISGTDTGFIVSLLEDNLNKYNPDMVITMMGLNDRGNTRAYGDTPVKKTTLFVKSFRTYKLTKLLWLHIKNKAREIGIYKPEDQKENIAVGADETQLTNFKELEKRHKKAIEINLKGVGSHVGLGWWYWNQEKYDQAEEMFKKAIEINPKNDQAYIELGWLYENQEKNDKAAEVYKKAIEINPGNVEAYSELGWLYEDQGKYDRAEEMFKKAIDINPKNYEAYMGLGWYYRSQKKHDKTEEMFKKAIEINSEKDWVYVDFGWWYRDQGKYDQAEEMFKKAITLNPNNVGSYVGLGWWYRDQGKYDQAEEMFKKAIEINPESDRLFSILALLYEEQGKNKSAEEYFGKVDRLRLGTYNSTTRRNYQRLKEIVTQGGIRLVCVQYPMRSVEPVKKMLKPHDGIIFVDNERVFKEALRYGRYDEYFEDSIGGDFGHCTRKGNRLLAENIADVILKEYFNINK